jgi:hypothetical protein
VGVLVTVRDKGGQERAHVFTVTVLAGRVGPRRAP